MNETKSIAEQLDELKELIYRTYYLYTNSTDIVIKAECEERLQKLFIHKSELEHLVIAVNYIARRTKIKTSSQKPCVYRALLKVGPFTNLKKV